MRIMVRTIELVISKDLTGRFQLFIGKSFGESLGFYPSLELAMAVASCTFASHRMVWQEEEVYLKGKCYVCKLEIRVPNLHSLRDAKNEV